MVYVNFGESTECFSKREKVENMIFSYFYSSKHWYNNFYIEYKQNTFFSL